MDENRVVDFAGVAIGTVREDRSAVDFSGVRFGALHAGGDVVDFGGVRVGLPEPARRTTGPGSPGSA